MNSIRDLYDLVLVETEKKRAIQCERLPKPQLAIILISLYTTAIIRLHTNFYALNRSWYETLKGTYITSSKKFYTNTNSDLKLLHKLNK